MGEEILELRQGKKVLATTESVGANGLYRLRIRCIPRQGSERLAGVPARPRCNLQHVAGAKGAASSDPRLPHTFCGAKTLVKGIPQRIARVVIPENNGQRAHPSHVAAFVNYPSPPRATVGASYSLRYTARGRHW